MRWSMLVVKKKKRVTCSGALLEGGKYRPSRKDSAAGASLRRTAPSLRACAGEIRAGVSLMQGTSGQ